MPIQWSDELITGFEEIDNQHKELIKRINELHSACRGGRGKDIIVDIMDFLGNYILFHFGAEERLMGQYSYPDTDIHRNAHQEFVKRYSELKNNFNIMGERLISVLETTSLLGDWWINHINRMDKALASFLRLAR